MHSHKKAASDIAAYVEQRRGRPAAWFAGTAINPHVSLIEHAINPDEDPWIYAPTKSSGEALKAHAALMALGLDGSPDLSPDARFVYAYRKTISTLQTLVTSVEGHLG